MAPGPKMAPISEKRKALKVKAKKKKASATSRSLPLITSVIPARPEQPKRVSTTKKKPALRPNSNTSQTSAASELRFSFPEDAVPAASLDQDIHRASARQSASVGQWNGQFRH